MDPTLRVILAAVLVAAAIAKLRDPAGLRAAVRRHGVPAPVAGVAGVGLVAVEAVVAALLLVPATARAAGWAVVVLGVAFALSLARLRLSGVRRAPCGCFGPGRERPVALSLAQALALATVGALVGSAALARPWPAATALLTAALALLGVVVALLVVLVLALYRQVGVLESRLGPRSALELPEEGPPVGRPAPTLAELGRRGDELIAFGSPGCRLCAEIAPGLTALERDGLTIHAVREDESPDVFSLYAVPGTPFVVHVIDGVVAAKGLVNTLEQIEELIAVGRERVVAA